MACCGAIAHEARHLKASWPPEQILSNTMSTFLTGGARSWHACLVWSPESTPSCARAALKANTAKHGRNVVLLRLVWVEVYSEMRIQLGKDCASSQGRPAASSQSQAHVARLQRAPRLELACTSKLQIGNRLEMTSNFRILVLVRLSSTTPAANLNQVPLLSHAPSFHPDNCNTTNLLYTTHLITGVTRSWILRLSESLDAAALAQTLPQLVAHCQREAVAAILN